MEIEEYKAKTIEFIEGYLKGIITEEEASAFALDVIKTENMEKHPTNISNAIQFLFDLHDKNESWSPTREELENCLIYLKSTGHLSFIRMR